MNDFLYSDSVFNIESSTDAIDHRPVGNCCLSLASGRFLFVDPVQERFMFSDCRYNPRLTVSTINDQLFVVCFSYRRFTQRTTDA